MARMQPSMSPASQPFRTFASPLQIWCESGASITAFTTVGQESTSPQPTMPDSVAMRMRQVS